MTAMTAMTAMRVFVTENNQATFICPKCGNLTTRDVKQFKDINQVVKIKCKCHCGYVYSVILERRKFRRRKTDLPGFFVWGNMKNKTKMTVKDLSCLGLKFEQKDKHNLKIGDVLFVEFRLDDKYNSSIKKEVIVRTIHDSQVGAAFCSLDPEDFLIMSEYSDIS